MKKFTETIADDDYRNSDGLLVCGRCGTPKEMRLSTELLGGHTAIVPIPCECMKRAEAERRERELAAERKRKIERARTECFAGCAFFRGCTFDADDGRTPQIAAICKGYADTFSRDDMNGLLLWGKVGTGKSFYASAIANRVIDLGFSALQTSVQDIVTHIESVPFNERENAKSRLLKYDLLVIDDLGRTAAPITSWGMSTTSSTHVTRTAGRWSSRRTSTQTSLRSPMPTTPHAGASSRAPWSAAHQSRFAGENRREYKMMEMREAMAQAPRPVIYS